MTSPGGPFMVRDIRHDEVTGERLISDITPALFASDRALEVEKARQLTRGLRHAPQNLQLVLTATELAPSTARRALSRLAEAAGATESDIDAIRTIISEAVTNVVRHAYDGEPGLVHVDAAVIDGDLTVLVVDDGHGPRLPSAQPGLGLGWKLLAQMTDRWAVTQRGEGGTLVYMRLRLGAGDSVAGI